MVVRIIASMLLLAVVGCERLSPEEAKLVGSWRAETPPDSVTIFTFERNHRDWCVVTYQKDTWLDGTTRWHISGNEIVFDDVSYPKVAPETAAKDPELVNRPNHYTANLEQIGPDTIRVNGITLTRTSRPAKPNEPAPFSP